MGRKHTGPKEEEVLFFLKKRKQKNQSIREHNSSQHITARTAQNADDLYLETIHHPSQLYHSETSWYRKRERDYIDKLADNGGKHQGERAKENEWKHKPEIKKIKQLVFK